tara:strand:- start:242 stop:583 length:342 start_codon:yes stop_codon:yes gene_type:complete
MAKTRAFQELITIAKANAGVIDLTSPEVLAFLQITPKTPKGRMYRMPSYIWDIKHYASLDVKAVRKGRTVVSYVLPALVPVTAIASTGEEADGRIEAVIIDLSSTAINPNVTE